MSQPIPDPDATRASLLIRLRDLENQASWEVFFNTYWRLIYGVARRAGLTDSEAQDAAQETFAAVARQMPGFRYDPALGSFKGWLLQRTRWCIGNVFRKRLPVAELPPPQDGETRTSPTARLVDPNSPDLDALWEADWRQNLLDAALARVKRQIDPQKFQIFDLYVNKEWPAQRVAEVFGVSVNQVYLARTRVAELIRQEVERLERETT